MAGISGTSCRLQNMKLRAVVLCMITVFLSSANGTDIRHRKDTSFSGSLLDPNVTQAISSWIQNVRHGLWMTSFPNAALKTVNDVIFQLGTSYGSYKCFQDVRLSLKRLAVTKNSDVMIDWSLQMLDSMGKPPSGLLQGNIFWLGNYDQCITIEVDTRTNATIEHKTKFTGEYCLIEIMPKLKLKLKLPFLIAIRVGVCFPSTCSFEDKTDILNSGVFRPLKSLATVNIKKDFCQTKDSQTIDAITIGIIVCISIWVLVVLAATAVDYRVSHQPQPKEGFFQIKLILTKLFTSFSAIRSWNGIFHTEAHDSELSAIHGIRVISMLWVILGHVVMVSTLDYPWKNHLEVTKMFDYIYLQPFGFNATMSVQTFFLISGLLVSFNFMKHKISNGWLNLCGYIAFRYLRLTPPYLLVIMVLIGPYYLWNTGPMWPKALEMRNACRDTWWRNILYINKFWHDKECLPPSWYLTVDTQLYCLAPIFLFTVYRKPRLGYGLLALGFVSSIAYSFIMILVRGYETYGSPATNVENFSNFREELFFKAIYNMPAYIVGLTVGYLLYLIKKSKLHLTPVKANQLTFAVILWIIALSMMFTIIFGSFSYNKGLSTFSSVTYGAFARPIWAICVAWVILACSVDWGGPINRILSLKIFVPFSRVTYSAYLVHYPIVFHHFVGQKDGLYFSIHNIAVIITYCALVSYGAAIILAILVESPIVELVHVIWKLRPVTWANNNEQAEMLIKKRDASSLTTGILLNKEIDSD